MASTASEERCNSSLGQLYPCRGTKSIDSHALRTASDLCHHLCLPSNTSPDTQGLELSQTRLDLKQRYNKLTHILYDEDHTPALPASYCYYEAGDRRSQANYYDIKIIPTILFDTSRFQDSNKRWLNLTSEGKAKLHRMLLTGYRLWQVLIYNADEKRWVSRNDDEENRFSLLAVYGTKTNSPGLLGRPPLLILRDHVAGGLGMKEMAHFNPPVIQENPSGWGPCTIPEQFKDMPYQPFSKGDRLGKVADWTGVTYQDRRYMNKYNSQFGGGMANQYAYYHEDDESTFQLVDTARVQKPIYQRGRMKFNQNKLRRERERRAQQQANMQVLSKTQKSRERDRQRQLRKWQKQFGKQMQDQHKKVQIKNRDASVQVRDTWNVVEELDFPRLVKLSLPNIEDPTDLYLAGAVEFYDKQYDRVTTKNEKRLKRINRVFHKVTTTDDPVIRKLAKTQGNVFATDAILATLMCCSRSTYSWDVVVQRVGNKLFFDKRDDSDFDLLTVSETAIEPPQDEGNSINSPRNLALEATFINHNFSQQVLKMNEERHGFENKNPFTSLEEEEGEVASVAYRYRKWNLGNDIELIVRCEHDAAFYGPNGELQFMNIKALNEWDSRCSGGVDWRAKLDNQRGAVLATELKNNSCKLAKWTVGALLSGSDQLKFGYVSRQNVRDTSKHVILGTQQFKPSEFANQINLNMDNAWGVLRCVVDICLKLKQGKYLIMKDPNKPVIRIYDIPNNTFESDEDDDDEDDEEEEEEEDDDEDEEPEKDDSKKEKTAA